MGGMLGNAVSRHCPGRVASNRRKAPLKAKSAEKEVTSARELCSVFENLAEHGREIGLSL